MFKIFFSFLLLLTALISQQSMAVTASVSSKDHILKLFEKEIIPTQAEFVFDVYANSKVPLLGFSLYSKQVIEQHKIPLKIVARPDLTSEEALSKGLLMYEFIPTVEFVKKFSWALRVAHDLRSFSVVRFQASVQLESGQAQREGYIGIGEGDRLLSQNKNYPANQSLMYGTERAVTYLYRNPKGEIKLESVLMGYYRRDDSFTRTAPAAKSECAISVSGR